MPRYAITIKTGDKPVVLTLKAIGGEFFAQVVVDQGATWDVGLIQRRLKESRDGTAGFVKKTIPSICMWTAPGIWSLITQQLMRAG